MPRVSLAPLSDVLKAVTRASQSNCMILLSKEARDRRARATIVSTSMVQGIAQYGVPARACQAGPSVAPRRVKGYRTQRVRWLGCFIKFPLSKNTKTSPIKRPRRRGCANHRS